MTDSEKNLTPSYDDEIDFLELLRALWAGKWLIGGVTTAAAIVSIVLALMLPDIYRAETLLAPNDQNGASGLSALAAQYSGLASLAGVSLSSGDVDKTSLGLEVLKSRKFISEFVNRHDLLVPLIAANGWDAETGELQIDADDYDQVSGQWIRDVRPPKKTVPSMQEAYEAFMEILSVSQDKKTTFVTVAIEHYSPVVAAQWANWLIDDLNTSIMEMDVAEAEQAIEYLNDQIQNTSLAELRNIFFGLIEEQTKTVMLAKVTEEYLLKTIDPAVVPEEKFRPTRSLIVILTTIFGGLVGVFVQLVRPNFASTK